MSSCQFPGMTADSQAPRHHGDRLNRSKRTAGYRSQKSTQSKGSPRFLFVIPAVPARDFVFWKLAHSHTKGDHLMATKARKKEIISELRDLFTDGKVAIGRDLPGVTGA